MKASRLITVEPVRFLFAVGLGIQSKATASLVQRKVCLASALNGTACGPDHGPARHAPDGGAVGDDAVMTWCFYLEACACLLGALVSGVYGPASDKFGRRGSLILPPLGMILGAAGCLVQAYHARLPVHYLLVSSALTGLGGYTQLVYIATMSYVCDITDHGDRSLRLGLVAACGLVGASVGLLLGAGLLSLRSEALVFLVAILVQAAVILLVTFRLEESVLVKIPWEEEDDDGGVDWRAGCTPRRVCSEVTRSLKRTLMVYATWRTDNRRQLLLINQTVGILSTLGSSGEFDLTFLYTSRPPLGWGPTTLLAYSATKSALRGLALFVGMPLLFAYVGHWRVRTDMVVAMTTSLSNSSSLILMAFSYTTLMMMLAPLVGCLGGFPVTLIASIKCKLVEPYEFGALFACTMIIQTVFRLVGKVAFKKLYVATLYVWPRLAFLGMGIFFVMLLSIIMYMWCLSGLLDKADQPERADVRKELLFNAFNQMESDSDEKEEEIELFLK